MVSAYRMSGGKSIQAEGGGPRERDVLGTFREQQESLYGWRLEPRFGGGVGWGAVGGWGSGMRSGRQVRAGAV